MKLQSIFSLAAFCGIEPANAAGGLEHKDIIAHTQQGAVRGVQVHDRVDAFLGVPYAQPPVGKLRFHPPQPLEIVREPKAREPFNATRPSPACYQFRYNSILGDSLKPSTPESEDCLTLNIYVPKKTSKTKGKKLPVYVWSYGGGFGEGAASVPLYDPTDFVAESRDIIVVTWNYRLNIFGFPNSPALRHQNLGIRDQRLALEWLRDNLDSFGGDPRRIVFGGQSAGADSGHSMVYSHPRDPIVSALLLQSGMIEIVNARTAGADFEYVRVAGAVGCLNSDRAKELECMRMIDADRLKHAITNSTLNRFGSPYGGMPMADNVTVFTNEEYAKRGKAGHFARLPTLMGMMLDEGDGVANWDPVKGINKTISRIMTETLFECNMIAETGYRAKHHVPVWRYLNKGVFPEVTTFPWARAYHAADIPLLMGTYNLMAGNKTADHGGSTTKEASRFLQHFFAAFIRDPTHGLKKSYGLPIYEPNTSTSVELFKNNKPALTRILIPDNPACAHPTPLPENESP
ncbi:hypothetical protein JDV02_000900 [Purpureocillium takamizusanense]|uniref:Carboxylesterase type B domain-containing protein n=1 Tax=Purpureocillium takamizusanense TaxID=2060973 RepID=A0A9Q8V609_9HYPO|nr:uncharacterized protein JDV02_000900 [Purpureocillium takamizusanense]UNI14253.1 hypothetical protein JDV02_000900 [Purpureocillium takamizusanense]